MYLLTSNPTLFEPNISCYLKKKKRNLDSFNQQS